MNISIIGPLFFAGRMAIELRGHGHDIAGFDFIEVITARGSDAPMYDLELAPLIVDNRNPSTRPSISSDKIAKA